MFLGGLFIVEDGHALNCYCFFLVHTRIFLVHTYNASFVCAMQSDLSDVSPNEEFVTSLGVDQSIRITCQPIATVHHTRSGLLGGAKTSLVTYTHTFEVKNTKTDAVDMKLLEQVPLSTDERIKVLSDCILTNSKHLDHYQGRSGLYGSQVT